jgi:DNA-binding XRE family transcriptional regulator
MYQLNHMSAPAVKALNGHDIEIKTMSRLNGKRIRARRLELGYSMKQIGRAAGTTAQTVEKIERGITKASRYAMRIVTALWGEYEHIGYDLLDLSYMPASPTRRALLAFFLWVEHQQQLTQRNAAKLAGANTAYVSALACATPDARYAIVRGEQKLSAVMNHRPRRDCPDLAEQSPKERLAVAREIGVRTAWDEIAASLIDSKSE